MYRTEIRLLLLAGLLGCSAGDDVPAPLIASVTPSHGTPGTSVMIIGDYFCQEPEGDQCDNGGTVAFDATPANVGMYSEHTIMVEVPGVTPGVVDVTVTAAGRTSNNIEFRIELP
jgi:hypothetical protein